MNMRLFGICCILMLFMAMPGCDSTPGKVNIGVSMGVGPAARWAKEKMFMEERARELGVDIEVRLNLPDSPKDQLQDCKEMIDSGIQVLVLTPRNVYEVGEIIDYAKSKNVKVISYARSVFKDKVDLFVGYDSLRIGQTMGQFLTEKVLSGNIILLKGAEGDYNATLLYAGAMRYIDPLRGEYNVILDAMVPGWSPEEAKTMVKRAVAENNNKVDGILAPNDTVAGACAAALEELGVQGPVVITGMDAELAAVRRIVAGKQDMTVYLDLKELAETAVTQAVNMARRQPVLSNADFDNQSGNVIAANLTAGRLVIRQNVDAVLIESGYYTKEQVYGH